MVGILPVDYLVVLVVLAAVECFPTPMALGQRVKATLAETVTLRLITVWVVVVAQVL